LTEPGASPTVRTGIGANPAADLPKLHFGHSKEKNT